MTLNIFVRCLVILLRQTCCCRLDSHAFNASKSPRILCGWCSLSPACCSFVAASLRLATTVPPNTAVVFGVRRGWCVNRCGSAAVTHWLLMITTPNEGPGVQNFQIKKSVLSISNNSVLWICYDHSELLQLDFFF